MSKCLEFLIRVCELVAGLMSASDVGLLSGQQTSCVNFSTSIYLLETLPKSNPR